jgi:hypothetical protein
MLAYDLVLQKFGESRQQLKLDTSEVILCRKVIQ